MASYNARKYISDSIDSIIAQTYHNWELLITDDCSADGTRDILKQYEEKDSRVRVAYMEKNLGAGHTRNRSIERAQGRYIAFCDSDDRWMPTKLEQQINFMKEKDCGMVFSSYIVCDENNNNKGVIIAPRKQSLFQTKCDDKIGFLTCMYDTEKIGGKMLMPTIRKRQDYAHVLQVLQKCKYAYGMKEPLAYYRIHTGSISHNKWSLIKYEVETYKLVFGHSTLTAYLFLFFFFMPTYTLKQVKKRVDNLRKRKYLSSYESFMD